MAAGVDLQGATAVIAADAWPKGLNRELRRLAEEEGVKEFVIDNPRSRHNLAVGQTADAVIRFRGSVGNYCGGLNSGTTIYVERNAGWAAGEAMAAGKIVVEGNANMATGASMRGGTIHIKGSAAARCGVSLKGGTLIVEGDVGYLSAFMTHAGDLIVCGSTGAAFADSLWQGNVWVAGEIRSLGTDATVIEASDADQARVHGLLRENGVDGTFAFRKVVSGQKLWYFNNRNPDAWLKI
jgi:methylamine---glutamate N-methyltransferase subunit B